MFQITVSIEVIVLSIFILLCFVIMAIYMIKHRKMEKYIDKLMNDYQCFNLKVVYDSMMLDKLRAIINANDFDHYKKKEIMELLAHCQQSITCESITSNIKKICTEENKPIPDDNI